ncbi:hypothetical protein MYX07_01170 [Patescibacteria group bacterium AH-259-L07]|nr:hypothetical protein [Patescibacteria group bacterium AH-259-L07]
METISSTIEQFDADWTIFDVDTNKVLKALGKNSVEEIPKQKRFYLYNRYILLKKEQGYEFPYGFGGAVVSKDNQFEGMYFYSDSTQALIVPSYEIKPLLEKAQADLRQSQNE